MVADDINLSFIVDVLGDVFGDSHLHSDYRGQISFDCPVCSHDIKGLDHGDGKGNLEINYHRFVYKCWSCAETHDTQGSLFTLMKKYGTPRQMKQFLLYVPDEIKLADKPEYQKIRLPKEFMKFTEVSQGRRLTHQYKQAERYVRSRNITDEMINKYNIGYCESGLYENRIIIPSYDTENEINYFVARSFLSRTKLKYRNPSVDKEQLIWNEHLINWDETVYVVEGAFDSIFLKNSIPMLGKYMTNNLFMKLYNNAKRVVIVLDGDAWTDTEKLYHKLNCGKMMGKVWVIKLPVDSDIADLQGDLSKYEEIQLD